MDNKPASWQTAEQEAAEWFLNHYSAVLLARNLRFKQGELDLIFEQVLPNETIELVFIEVRTRSLNSWVSAVESVTFAKQPKLSRAVRLFLARYRGPAKSIRMDILARDGATWTHIRNIGLGSDRY